MTTTVKEFTAGELLAQAHHAERTGQPPIPAVAAWLFDKAIEELNSEEIDAARQILEMEGYETGSGPSELSKGEEAQAINDIVHAHLLQGMEKAINAASAVTDDAAALLQVGGFQALLLCLGTQSSLLRKSKETDQVMEFLKALESICHAVSRDSEFIVSIKPKESSL